MPLRRHSEETRTSPWTAQGRVALQELQQVIPHCSGLVELFEIFAKGVGYVFFQSQLCLLASRRAQRSDSGQINCELFEPARRHERSRRVSPISGPPQVSLRVNGDDVTSARSESMFAFWADARSTTCVVASRVVKLACAVVLDDDQAMESQTQTGVQRKQKRRNEHRFPPCSRMNAI